jgi:UPF0755 protein
MYEKVVLTVKKPFFWLNKGITFLKKDKRAKDVFEHIIYFALDIIQYPYQRKFKKLTEWVDLKLSLPQFVKIAIRALVIGLICFVFFMIAVLFQVSNRFDHDVKILRIENNSSANMIGYDLNRLGLIDNIFGFRTIVRLFGTDSKIHAGEYALSQNMSLFHILLRIQEKKGLSLTSAGVSVTIPEGFSLTEIADLLDKKEIINRNKFVLYANKFKDSSLYEKYPFLQQIPVGVGIEGYLFPDTYSIPKNSEPYIILDTMLTRFNEKLAAYDAEIKNSKLNLHQLITLASIIEKEAVKQEERSLIAGVFYNRLDKGIPLGSCPTVKYAMGKPRLPYLLYKHLKYESPYNTYIRRGLPPGPIASPGLESIKAALRPQATIYLFFVSNGDGTHTFTTNDADHLKAKNEILKKTGGKIY